MSTDKKNLDDLQENCKNLNRLLKSSKKYTSVHPLDKEIQDLLKKITFTERDDEFRIFIYQKEIKELWVKLLEKSIICLRYFDIREPFMESKGQKKPIAYGIEELSNFFENYTDFESALYGSVKYYRDHVMHVFRVWVLGINLLLRENGKYLQAIQVMKGYDFSSYEKISIWTIVALTHDLGYPLEKAYQIIDKTNSMMKSFVTNPTITMDVSFSGVQNSMNDFVLRFVSSKMWEIDKNTRKIKEETIDYKALKPDEKDKIRFVARLQPKYYFKFQKSLEHNQHGVLSALIIYKLLLYFLESDYSLNEDYMFRYEDSRQYYIRREILRPIASHTCKDIYQNDAFCFSFLLLICDDAQEWGRKNISQLYVNEKDEYEFDDIKMEFKKDETFEISISDEYKINDINKLRTLLENYYRQCIEYRNLFRDGQDTCNRNFNFKRHLWIKSSIDEGKSKYNLTFDIKKDSQTKLIIKKEQDTIFKKDDSVMKVINEAFHNKKKGWSNKNCFEIAIDRERS